MASPTLYFLRHGQTDWNVEYRLQGQMDIPINATGRDQARQNGRALAALLDDPSRFRYVASPLGRTRETMNIVRQELGLPSFGYETDDRLKEVSFGLWSTHTFAELEQKEPEAVAARHADKWDFCPPLGESYAMLLKRIESWLPYMREDAVIVCHGGILRVLDHHFNGTTTEKAVQQLIPQDKIFKWDGTKAVWLNAES